MEKDSKEVLTVQAAGKLGGKARAEKLTPKRRQEIAKKASAAAAEARKAKWALPKAPL